MFYKFLSNFVLLSTLVMSGAKAHAEKLEAHIIEVKDRVIHLKTTKKMHQSNTRIFIYDKEGDFLEASIQKKKPKQIWLKPKDPNEQILWEKGDLVFLSKKKPKLLISNDPDRATDAMVLSYNLGLVTGSNNVLLEEAENAYDAQSTQGQLLSLSLDKRFSTKRSFYSVGIVTVLGQISQVSSYDSGEINLKYQAVLVGLNLNVGFNFMKSWYFLFGLHQYHPIYHIVSIDSPTGSITHTPDTSFEIRAHSTKLAWIFHEGQEKRGRNSFNPLI